MEHWRRFNQTVRLWQVDELGLPDDELKATGTLLSVLTQLTQCDAAHPAVVAAVWVVVSVVCDDVSLHVRQMFESGVAVGAAVKTLPRVCKHVSSEAPPPRKPCRTHSTLVGLDALVYLHVHNVV